MPMPVRVQSTEIDGVLLLESRLIADERGFFSETYSKRMYAEAGLDEAFVQDNLSGSAKGVVRGLHYQIHPHAMGKLVRVVQGAVFDVAVDVRPGSPTFGKWVARTLTAENGLSMWVPVGFAHGFLSLDDNSLVHYKCTEIHTPEAERAIHYKDPTLAIAWPFEPTIVSPKDQQAPMLANAELNFTQ